MSDELDAVIENASKVPIRPKKVPYIKPEKRQTRTKQQAQDVKDAALAIISDAFKDEKEKNRRALSMVKRAEVEVAAVHEAFKNFEEALGGRKELITALQHCPDSSNGSNMVRKLLSDPDFLVYVQKEGGDNVRYSLSAICNRHRIPFNAVVAAFRDAKTAQIAVEALTTLSTKAPRVVEQIAEDAQNQFIPCTVCEGSTRIRRINELGEWDVSAETGEVKTQLCHNCRGTGKVFKEHDVHNRKLFLEMTGLVTKTPLVNQQFNQQAHVYQGDFIPGDGSFEKLIKAVDAMPVQVDRAEEGKTETIEVPYSVYEEDNANKESKSTEEGQSKD